MFIKTLGIVAALFIAAPAVAGPSEELAAIRAETRRVKEETKALKAELKAVKAAAKLDKARADLRAAQDKAAAIRAQMPSKGLAVTAAAAGQF